MNEEFFNNLVEKAKLYFKFGKSHEFGHTERVLNNSLKIAENENVDLDVLKTAAILHDIMREEEDSGKIECHAEEGGEEARKILEKTSFPKDKIEEVVSAIKCHRLSKNLKATSKEGEILQDADRLDSLGAILIARAFSSAHVYNRPFYSDDEKNVVNFIIKRVNKLKPELFNTKKAKIIAKERYDYSQEFLDRFIKELGGKL
jgi:uncharacterized protein